MAAVPWLSLIVPAYNEVNSIGRMLVSTQEWLNRQPWAYEIIVCADGDDGTRELVAGLAGTDSRLSVLGSRQRGGKGRGIRHGVALARGQIIGFADADNKTPISELAKLLPWLANGYDMVVGSRALADSTIEVRQPWHRRAGSRTFAIAMRLITGLWGIHDTQCGFKFFRHEVAKKIFRLQRIDGYMFDVEILCLARRLGCRIREIGVRWRDDGDSRLRLVAGNWQNLVDLLRIRFRRNVGVASEFPAETIPQNTARKAA